MVPVATVHELATPLNLSKAAKAAPPPQLTYRGGPLIANVEVVTIFWGRAFATPTQASFVQHINDFFDAILDSILMKQLAEYSVPGYKLGNGKRVGSVTITRGVPKVNVTDAAIQTFITKLIAAGTVPKPNKNSLYFVYLPPGVSVTQGGSRSCQAFCGYHSDIDGHTYYAVMPYPTCKGCTGSLPAFEALTSTSSHELIEAITDPVPGTGWYDDNHGEIGDICAWTTKVVNGYTVQLEWSNKLNKCV